MHPRDYAAFAQPLATLPSSTREEESARALSGAICRAPGKQGPQLVQTAPSGLIRTQQILVLQNLWVPCVPSYSGSDGGWVLDRVIAQAGGASWWMAVNGRYRLQKWLTQRPRSQAWLDSLVDPANTAVGARLRWAPTSRTSFNFAAEVPVASRSAPPPALRASMRRNGPRHLTTVTAALDCEVLETSPPPGFYRPIARHVSAEWGTRSDRLKPGSLGLQYQLGISRTAPDAPVAQAGLAWDVRTVLKPSPGKRMDEEQERRQSPRSKGEQRVTPGTERMRKALVLPPKESPGYRKGYSLFQTGPSLKLAASAGALARLPLENDPSIQVHPLASISACAQVGRFARPVLDHTEVAARLDLGLSRPLQAPSSQQQEGGLSSFWRSATPDHTVTVSLSQQLIGPLRARADAHVVRDPGQQFLGVKGAGIAQAAYGVDCMVPGLKGSARLAAWYSPTRKEGMAELRIF